MGGCHFFCSPYRFMRFWLAAENTTWSTCGLYVCVDTCQSATLYFFPRVMKTCKRSLCVWFPCRENRERINLTWSADGTELTYNEVISYYFDQDSSSPDVDEFTPITTLNAHMVVSAGHRSTNHLSERPYGGECRAQKRRSPFCTPLWW